MTQPHPRWASKEQAAQHISVNPETIDRWREQGLITAYRAGPRLIRYNLNELDQMMINAQVAANE